MSYTPTTWKKGDKITATKLNKMERGIAEGGSGGGVTICQCTYDDEEDIVTSTMTAAEMWAACQTGVVVCQYSYETLGGSEVTMYVPVSSANLEADGDDHVYIFQIGVYDLRGESDSDYPASEGGK